MGEACVQAAADGAADGAARTGTVIDDGLGEAGFDKFLRDGATQGVVERAGREGHDDADLFGGVGLRLNPPRPVTQCRQMR